jgi:HPt (histidine-containing phosphotransfer) domain-containing protein
MCVRGVNVPLTNQPAAYGPAAMLDLTYDDVRLSFLVRLHSEETRLAQLGAALKSAEADPAAAFVNLEMFAHRLRGAAAVFDFPELRDAAKELELAAAAAVTQRASFGEPLVQAAMRILATCLTCLNGFTRPSRPAATPLPAN